MLLFVWSFREGLGVVVRTEAEKASMQVVLIAKTRSFLPRFRPQGVLRGAERNAQQVRNCPELRSRWAGPCGGRRLARAGMGWHGLAFPARVQQRYQHCAVETGRWGRPAVQLDVRV